MLEIIAETYVIVLEIIAETFSIILTIADSPNHIKILSLSESVVTIHNPYDP